MSYGEVIKIGKPCLAKCLVQRVKEFRGWHRFEEDTSCYNETSDHLRSIETAHRRSIAKRLDGCTLVEPKSVPARRSCILGFVVPRPCRPIPSLDKSLRWCISMLAEPCFRADSQIRRTKPSCYHAIHCSSEHHASPPDFDLHVNENRLSCSSILHRSFSTSESSQRSQRTVPANYYSRGAWQQVFDFTIHETLSLGCPPSHDHTCGRGVNLNFTVER